MSQYTPFDLTHTSVNMFRRADKPTPIQELSLEDALGLIQGKRYRARILALRQLLANGDQAGYDTAKAQLAAITFCGTFAPTRAKENLVQHIGVAHGDIDHLDDLPTIRQRLCLDVYTLYCFISPSGFGLKVGIRITVIEDDAHYKNAWQAVAEYHLREYGIAWDTSGKDISRLCYVSHDPDLYVNPDALCFPVPTMIVPPWRPKAATAHTVPLPTDERNRYAIRAISIATDMIRSSADGARHAARLKASELLGGYIAGGVLTYDEAYAALDGAVSQNTDHYDQSMKTIAGGLAHGQKTPITREDLAEYQERQREAHGHASRQRPHTNGQQQASQPVSEPTRPPGPLVTIMSTVTAENPEWLWWPYIQIAAVGILDGDPGIGKTLLMTQLAASLSLGYPLPDQQGKLTLATGKPSHTLLLSIEDSLSATLKPRLDQAKADSSKIHVLTGWLDERGQERVFTLQHIVTLEQAIQQVKPRLVVIDPVTSYMGKADIHRANEVQQIMAQLTRLADRYRCAIVCIRHPAKPGQHIGKVIHRGLGSVGFIGTARTGLFVEEHPINPNKVLLGQSKNNSGRKGRTQVFSKIEGQFAWCGVSRVSAEVLGGSGMGPDPHTFLRAVFLLEENLSNVPRPSKDIERAMTEEGIQRNTLYKAKAALGVVSIQRREGKDQHWDWKLPGLTLIPTPPFITITTVNSANTEDTVNTATSDSKNNDVETSVPKDEAQYADVAGVADVADVAVITVVPHEGDRDTIPCVNCQGTSRWDDDGIARCIVCWPPPVPQADPAPIDLTVACLTCQQTRWLVLGDGRKQCLLCNNIDSRV